MRHFIKSSILPVVLALGCVTPALAAQCGNTAAGYEAWKRDFAKIAARAGVGERGLAALAGTTYATRTIAADRNQCCVRDCHAGL